jgi:hypothetical protein
LRDQLSTPEVPSENILNFHRKLGCASRVRTSRA